jgi:hypothetical protein
VVTDGGCKYDVHYLFDCDTVHEHAAVQPSVGAGLRAARLAGRMRVAAGVVKRVVRRYALPAAVNAAAYAVSRLSAAVYAGSCRLFLLIVVAPGKMLKFC